MFDAPIRDYGEDAGHAYDTLCNLYDELGQTKQKLELTRGLLRRFQDRRCARASISGWRSCSWMRTNRKKHGTPSNSRSRTRPAILGLPVLEINLLLAGGQSAQAKERAAFWLRSLGKRDDVMVCARIPETVAADPEAAMVDAGHGMDGGAGRWLREWVAQIENVRCRITRSARTRWRLRSSMIRIRLKNNLATARITASDDRCAHARNAAGAAPDRAPMAQGVSARSAVLDYRTCQAARPTHGTRKLKSAGGRSWRSMPTPRIVSSCLDDIVTALRQLQQSQYSWFDRLVALPILERSMAITEEAIRSSTVLAWNGRSARIAPPCARLRAATART